MKRSASEPGLRDDFIGLKFKRQLEDTGTGILLGRIVTIKLQLLGA